MKTMLKLRQLFFFIILGFISSSFGQADCILGVGVTSDSIISDIFQLNAQQNKELNNFSAELKYRKELLSNELDNFQKRHPQSTVTELARLADKYKSVMDSMQIVQALVDKKMLSLFNEKQYVLYRSLCHDASRSPHRIIPKIYPDSLKVKN